MIYDCFPFFNELDLLEIRLNTLCDVVDKFVIVESAKTHRGNDKPLYFQTNKERFANFLDKIIYVQCVFPPEVKSSWGRENYQRNKIADGLYDAKDDDYIILSDLDEIPSVQAIEYAKKTPRTVSVFDQRLFFYFLNCENKNNKWCGTVMYPYLLFKNGPVQSARKIAIMMNALLHDRRFPYFLKTEL
jgi:beta-1,4-mannosyl-glycoprotein beta-1,4-N-acetylglucosaminyltransferase